ncbi:hypothetical protein D1B33_08870 [Lysinibacillus yapensis]|uniref:DUF2642 domain-containing protein n=1 Tax=Ureibacillus yapensis TaxID=2304605 RepID=A0A396SD33_9BACL|nr:hypothetical protein [Lysinibacillus yapensis]RHW37627.1 hypothetical protein D1B33_08870 [Lysinibacillus yapensis]
MRDDFLNQSGKQVVDINAIRELDVTMEFRENVGNRALIIIFPFPFLIIGRIEKVESDYLFICAEVTNVTELDGEEFRVHIDDIEVFYIEKDHHRPIPDIRNGHHA